MDLQPEIGLIIIGLLIFLSAFFSSSETSITAIDKYKLKHKAKRGNKASARLIKLLDSPDKLLGSILLGNNVVNLTAASVTTLIAVRLGGEQMVATSTFVLTIVILIVAEIVPKTIATKYADLLAHAFSWPLTILVFVLQPILLVISFISGLLLKPFNLALSEQPKLSLSTEQLATVVREASGDLNLEHQNMVLSLLDLKNLTVRDALIPRKMIVGINSADTIEEMADLIIRAPFNRLPVYHRSINDVLGSLSLKKMARFVKLPHEYKGDTSKLLTLSRESIESVLAPPVFVPDSTPLYDQLVDFQQKKYDFGFVVDEYGDVEGIVTIKDVLQLLVGRLAQSDEGREISIEQITDTRIVVSGTTGIHAINQEMDWNLSTDGEARTISGLVMEHIETLPHGLICTKIDDYIIEVKAMVDSNITSLTIEKAPEPEAGD